MPTIYVLSKNMKNYLQFSSENNHFYSREISQYIASTCLRNALNFADLLINLLGLLI